MNIFVLDEDPTIAAQMQCDKHVVKMVLESAQLLCTTAHELGVDPSLIPYRKTHRKHPCALWARASWSNHVWLAQHAVALANEYYIRYGRDHKSLAVMETVFSLLRPVMFPSKERTQFSLAMPDQYKVACPVTSYRGYYMGEKAYMAKWNKGRAAPEWWVV